jgi:hypothetical protein
MAEFRTWIEDIQKNLPFMLPKPIGPEDKEALHLFGPVWHGTSADNREIIQHRGFQFFKGLPRGQNVSHGYEMRNYGTTNIPPPIHHMGFGTYFTRTKSIAKDFNFNTTKGLRDYYIGGPNYTKPKIEVINFGSPNTMMKWWRQHGYDMQPISNFKNDEEKERQWIKSTENLTNNLKSQYDAVYFKGKGIRRLLDGDQICVFRPEESVYYIDWNLSKGYDIGNGLHIKIGDRIQIKGTKATAQVIKIGSPRNDDPWNWAFPSVYAIAVSNIKGMGEIVKVHGPALMKAIEDADKRNEPIMATRRVNVGEANVQRWYDFNIEQRVFENKLPSALVAGVLKPREKTKSDWTKLSEALDREKRSRLKRGGLKPVVRQNAIYT